MGHLAPGEICENMLQLKRFGLYFEGILNRKWLLLYRISDISYPRNITSATCLRRLPYIWRHLRQRNSVNKI